MIELRTFGGIEVRRTHADRLLPLAAQPKRLALLAYLALADGSAYRRRDVVIAQLWPDLDTTHARGSLRQALHFLRRTLGDDVIAVRGEEEVGVRRAALWCDAAAFREHYAAHRFEEALGLYRGDFLDGFFVSDVSNEFEQWLADTRVTLRGSATACCWALSDLRRHKRDVTGAMALARRAVSLAPDDERGVGRLIALLDESGDRAGALDAYESFATRLRVEYDVEPSPETQALVRGVRGRTVPGNSPAPPSTPDLTATSPPSPATRAPLPTPTRKRLRWPIGIAAACVVTVLGFGLAARAAHGSARVPAPPSTQPTSLGRRTNPEALDAYVRGRYYWNERRAPSLLRAITLFTASLHADPTFAPAYSAMAATYVQLGYTNALAPGDAFPKARAAAERALELDASLAEPHAALGFVHLYYDWDWPAAEDEFRHALAADSADATAHEWYGLFLAAMGRFDEARAQERRAMALEPLSIAIAGTSGFVQYYAGDQASAREELRMALRADTAFPLGHFYLGRVQEQGGDLDSALAQYRATGPLRSWVPTIVAEGHLLATLGRVSEANAVLRRLDSLSHSKYVTPYGVALIYEGLQKPDSAFAWLERGYAERTNWMVWLNRDPRWASLRSDPRFASLTARMRLPR